MEKEIRVKRVADKVHAVERSIDDTLALAAELMIEMRGATVDLELAAQTSDGAFAKLVQAMTELQAARSSVVMSHKRMEKIREVTGVRTVGWVMPGKIEFDEETSAQAEASIARIA